jgi:hypothetical protein
MAEDIMDKADLVPDDRQLVMKGTQDYVRATNAHAHAVGVLNQIPREDDFGRKTREAEFSAENLIPAIQFMKRVETLVETPAGWNVN